MTLEQLISHNASIKVWEPYEKCSGKRTGRDGYEWRWC